MSFFTAEHHEGEYSPKLLDLIALIFMNDSLLYSQDTKEKSQLLLQELFCKNIKRSSQNVESFQS